MDEGVATAVTLVLGVVLFTGVICINCAVENAQDDAAITRMVEHGASPVAARCAIKGSSSDSLCAVLAVKASN